MLSSQQKVYFQFLKGLILFYQAKAEELIKFGDIELAQKYFNQLEELYNQKKKMN